MLYRLVQQHAATFFEQAQAAAGTDLPQFVKDEFDAFLECGILAHGFLRLRCGDCGHDKLVAFSCKRRGLCPSCGARRMAQTAAHLVDHVIPHVPVRQWVLPLPIPLCLLLASQPKLVTPVLQVVHRVITRTMKLLIRKGVLIEEEGHSYMASGDADSDEARVLRPLQAAACTYRIAFGPRAGQKVLTVQGAERGHGTAPAGGPVPREGLALASASAACKACPGMRTSSSTFASTSTASACMRLCGATPTTARGWNSHAATSRALRWPTSAYRPTPPGKWCSSSRQPGATAPGTS